MSIEHLRSQGIYSPETKSLLTVKVKADSLQQLKLSEEVHNSPIRHSVTTYRGFLDKSLFPDSSVSYFYKDGPRTRVETERVVAKVTFDVI